MNTLTRENYRSHPALNFSAAKHLLRSPAHFRWQEEHPIEPTEEMRMGTEIHKVLTGEPVVAVQKPEAHPEDPENLWHGNKKWCKEWLKAHDPNTVYGLDAFAAIHGCTDAINTSPLAQSLLRACDLREFPIVGEYAGTPIKGLLDAVGTDAAGRRFIVDMKTTNDASSVKFGWKARDMLYHMQSAWYCHLLQHAEGLDYLPAFIWLAVETEAPYAVAAYQADEDAMRRGADLMATAVDRYQQAQQSGKWAGYPSEIQTLTVRW